MSMLDQTLNDLPRDNPRAPRQFHGNPTLLRRGCHHKNNVIDRVRAIPLGERRVIHG